MKTVEEFYPENGPPNINTQRWLFVLVGVAVFILLCATQRDIVPRVKGGVIALLVIAAVTINYRAAVSVVISKADDTFTYHAKDHLNTRRQTVVRLADAKITFKYVYFSKYTQGWRLPVQRLVQ